VIYSLSALINPYNITVTVWYTSCVKEHMRHGQTERRILDYMLKGGQDTLEGIVHWWMLEQKIHNETAKVKEALDHLLAEGLVVELKGTDSRTHYRINPSMREKISKLLKEYKDF
jgi:hypothetical protein